MRTETAEGRLPGPLAWMAPAWGAWFVLYLVAGQLAADEGRTGLLSSTVEQLDSPWLALVFLDLPLQLVLAAAALLAARRGARRTAIGAGSLLSLLIAGHLVLSVVGAAG